MKAENFHRRLPELLAGELPDNERGAMEQALAQSKEFREVRFVAEVMREAFVDFSDEQLHGHPSAQYMLRYSEDRQGVPGHVRESIELHLSTCGVCQEVVERLGDGRIGESKPTEPRGRRKTAENRILRWLLHPALAASYLIAFIGLSAWILVRPPLAPTRDAPVTPAPQLVFADPLFRSDSGGSEPLRIETSATSPGRLHLLVQTELPELMANGSTATLLITDESGRSRSAISVPAGSINRLGTLSVVVDSTNYELGEIYRLQLVVEGQTVFERRIVLAEG